jgi:uroporphyrinogen-III synthase
MEAPDNQIKPQPQAKPLAGLRVLSLESRRAQEMAKLISTFGGEAIVAPSMQEVPLTSHVEALDFVRELIEGRIYMVIFLTGVGTRMLARVAQTRYSNENFVEALRKVAVVARGPKLAAALRELEVPVTVMIPEPNTWRDALRVLDKVSPLLPIRGRRVAVQEYGSSNPELIAGLEERGAIVVRVPIYQWALPDDTAPLRAAVESIARCEIDIALFTTSIQVVHLLRVAAEMNMEAALRSGLTRIVIGSIGPVTSEAILEHGLSVDFEPQHPKMGFLIGEAAQRAPELVRRKRHLQAPEQNAS